jgi:SSS family solute:Na+ symporter
MLAGSIAMVAVFVGKAGGFEAAIAGIHDVYPLHVPVAKQPPMLMLGALVFMTSFGVWGMPQLVQKFYAIKDEKMIGRAALVTTLFAVVITFSAYFIGALAHVFMEGVPRVNGAAASDRIIPALLTAHLPPLLMAVILLLVLSASMSTLSSLVLVSASAVAIDLYKGHINPRISTERSLAMMCFLSGVFVIFSYFIARYEFTVIVTLMSLSWGVVAGAFMAPYIYGLFWKRATRWGGKSGDGFRRDYRDHAFLHVGCG